MIKLHSIKITPEMLSIIANIDEFKGAWTVLENRTPEKLTNLKKVATIESIGSSNRIEGNKLTDKEIATILSNLKLYSFTSRDEQEVIGYAKLMDDIFDNYDVIPFTENYIKQLHKTLLYCCDKDESHRGEYKKLSNSVVAFDETGKEIGTVFMTSSPFDTPKEMRELINQTRELLEDNALHPLVLVALFVVHFLAIHPFQDGNGRLSRALTTLLLLKAGYSYVPYSSMEAVIEASKQGYYQALHLTQKSIKDNVDYEPWLMFFLRAMQKQKLHLEQKISNKIENNTSLSLLGVKIMELFDDKSRLTTPDIAELLNANQATVKKTMADLVKADYLIKQGSTRGAWYEKK